MSNVNKNNLNVYSFSRGEGKYSCNIIICNGGENTVATNIVAPEGTPPEVIARMLDNAEKQALDNYRVEVMEKCSSSKM